ncbi:MAG: phenylalanine--tRNA ligase subunit beta [Candidatus Bathyarchaeota archaeon]|nr:phenylalanine--tRNA ligase subunit beta [Candidatus Bathyarchaeota archaeon]
MPTIEVLFDDLQRLVGVKLPKKADELDDVLYYVKGQVESFEGETLKIEIKDGNRPDLWSVEGIARCLRGALGVEEGLRRYAIEGSSKVKVLVDSRLKKIRPYIACSILRNVKLDDDVIRELMHLQDKMDQTYGRKRRRTSLGLYNFDLIKPPLRYAVAGPTEVSFVPLDSTEEMTLKEILKKHPKGLEYGDIIRKHRYWPILMDKEDKVLSFPPIINSNDLGKITKEVENVLVEVTGTVFQNLLNTLTIVSLSLADRGGKIYSVEVDYPYGKEKRVITPKIENKLMVLRPSYVNEVLGLNLKTETMAKLLKKARYGVARSRKDEITVIVPCSRMDIMHPIDIVEDVAIMFGYNSIKPEWPRLATIGGLSGREAFSDLVREIMVGLGFQEVLSFSMSTPQKLFDMMNLERSPVVEVSNPRTLTYTCLRNRLMPSLMEFLSHNTHVEYPQKVFEVGECVVFDEKNDTKSQDIRKLACLIIHSGSNFSEIKATLDSLFLNLGIEYKLEETSHNSFIDGRVGKILAGNKETGIIGEINPAVIQEWKLGNPIAGFEINLDILLQIAKF